DEDRSAPQLPPIRRGRDRGAAPLSFAQTRMWFLEQFSPGAAGYEVAVAVRLTGSLDREALRAALGGLVARHEALRTRFPAVDGRCCTGWRRRERRRRWRRWRSTTSTTPSGSGSGSKERFWRASSPTGGRSSRAYRGSSSIRTTRGRLSSPTTARRSLCA